MKMIYEHIEFSFYKIDEKTGKYTYKVTDRWTRNHIGTLRHHAKLGGYCYHPCSPIPLTIKSLRDIAKFIHQLRREWQRAQEAAEEKPKS